MTRRTTRPALTPDQQAEADRIRQALVEASAEDIRELAELLATKDDSNTFGATEFTVRDIALRIGAKAIEAALQGRKKGATSAVPSAVRTAAKPPGSNAGGASRS
jgi:hypothetical protein